MIRQLVSPWIRDNSPIWTLAGAKEVSPMVTAKHARPCPRMMPVYITQGHDGAVLAVHEHISWLWHYEGLLCNRVVQSLLAFVCRLLTQG